MKVLDSGEVNLVDHMGNDLSICHAARVLPEYPALSERLGRMDKDKKLIRYMLKNKHNTPFEHVTFTFYVKAPIFVMRQWHRHRTWSYNETSARYKEMPEQFYVPDPKYIGMQSGTNHQGRDMSEVNVNHNKIAEVINNASCEAYNSYEYLLQIGCPRELARVVLPVNIYTDMYATVNLRSLQIFV